MTADIRTAARDEAFKNHYSHKQVPDRYDADLLIAGFMDGAEFWAARVTPTREQVAEVLAQGYQSKYRPADRLPVNHHDLRAADAVLALMQELTEGGSTS